MRKKAAIQRGELPTAEAGSMAYMLSILPYQKFRILRLCVASTPVSTFRLSAFGKGAGGRRYREGRVSDANDCPKCGVWIPFLTPHIRRSTPAKCCCVLKPQATAASSTRKSAARNISFARSTLVWSAWRSLVLVSNGIDSGPRHKSHADSSSETRRRSDCCQAPPAGWPHSGRSEIRTIAHRNPFRGKDRR